MPKSIYTYKIDHKCLNPKCSNITTNPRYCGLSCSTIHKNDQSRLRKIEKYNKNPKNCANPKCGKKIDYEKRHNKYCDQSCSAMVINSNKTSLSLEKQRKTLQETLKRKGFRTKSNSIILDTGEIIKLNQYSKISWKICHMTGKIYCSVNSNGHRRQCSPYAKDLKSIYYQLASFKFNVYKIPEYFNLSLLENIGWYSCPGKRRKKDAKNINGVSRDHLYSRSEGILNKVHPLK
jgi:hypothetical protein